MSRLRGLSSHPLDRERATFDATDETARKLLKGIKELHTYVERNQEFIRTTENSIAMVSGSRPVLSSRR